MSDEKILYRENPAMFRAAPLKFVLCVVLSVAVVGLIVLLVWWLQCKRTTLTVTDQRTSVREGLLSVSIKEVYHRDVRAVELYQSFPHRLLGVGTIGIASAGKAGYEIHVTGFPRVHEIKQSIDRHRRAA